MVTTPNLLRRGHYRATGIGTLTLVWSIEGVTELRFPEAGEPVSDKDVTHATLPRWIRGPLDRYFAGKPTDLNEVPVVLEGTAFQAKVWRALRSIPRGQVRSYGAIAVEVGSPRAMRAVGMANRSNPLPILVPCHRVIQAGHRLGGYSGGQGRKRFLLAIEGVELAGDRVHPGQLVLPRHPRRISRRSDTESRVHRR